MKILYITHKVPYPLSDGGKLRAFHHIKHLADKHEVVSLSFVKSSEELKGIRELEKYCKVETVKLSYLRSLFSSFIGLLSTEPLRVWYLKSRGMKRKAKELCKWADVVIVQALRMEQYGCEGNIIDIVDTPSLQIRRAIKHEGFMWRMIWRLELPRILRLEKLMAKKYNRVLVASEADRKALRIGEVLKNGTGITDIRRNVEQNSIMFLGNMEYQPNIDAVEYFLKNIFPSIIREVKDVKFYIVGKNPEKILQYRSRNVIVTGFVEDIAEYFAKSKVFVAPLRLGSGIQNKILEALNYEVPVVTTSIVNAGVECVDGKHLYVCDNAELFAKRTIELLQNDKLCDTISKAGKDFLKDNYSWQKIYDQLDNVLTS